MDQRVFLHVDWSGVEEGDAGNVAVLFNATTPEGTPGFLSPTNQVMLTVTANHTVPAGNFTGAPLLNCLPIRSISLPSN